MKTLRHFTLTVLTAFAVVAAALITRAEDAPGLLLPFPAEAANGHTAESTGEAHIPGRPEAAADKHAENVRRAQEFADTFIRRQQMEVANSVPRRGERPVTVPARSIAAAPTAAPVTLPGALPLLAARPAPASQPDMTPLPAGGPVSELLPLPGEEALGAPTSTVLPDSTAIIPGDAYLPPDSTSIPAIEAPVDGNEVPRSDLAPAPAYGGVEVQDRRGPVFRISGADAFKVARARGFKFSPAGGMGARDGNHTSASQFPNLITSEVHGPRMSQQRPPATWAVTETSNTFFMFCDANYNAVRLAPGWRIRGIRLEGPNWRWVACPRSGSNTASFSVRIHAYRNAESHTAVQLAGLTLEGPEGATDWKDAFPWINGRGPLQPTEAPASAPGSPALPEALATTGSQSGSEPPLPE